MSETRETRSPEPWLADLAVNIAGRGLAAPATLLIELVRPLGFLGSQLVLMLEPLGGDRAALWLQRARRLLEEPQQLETLQHLLAERTPSSSVDEGASCKPWSR